MKRAALFLLAFLAPLVVYAFSVGGGAVSGYIGQPPGNIILKNAKYLYGLTTLGGQQFLLGVNGSNQFRIGNTSNTTDYVASTHYFMGAGNAAIAELSASAINFDVSVTSTKACASGYTRLTPNYCAKSNPGTVALTTSTCTDVSPPAADATAIKFRTDITIQGSGTAGYATGGMTAYSDSGCTSPLYSNMGVIGAYDPSGVTADIGRAVSTVIVPLPTAGAHAYLLAGPTGSAASMAGVYGIEGYYD